MFKKMFFGQLREDIKEEEVRMNCTVLSVVPGPAVLIPVVLFLFFLLALFSCNFSVKCSFFKNLEMTRSALF